MAKAKAAPVEDELKRRVRRILDAREFARQRQDTDSDWTISELLALPVAPETVVRACAKNQGAWHRVGSLMRLCASLPEIDIADDTLRRGLSSKDEDKKRMAIWATGFGGRVEMAEEVAACALDTKMGDWTRDHAIGALGTLATRDGLPALLELAKKPRKLERTQTWVTAWGVLRSLVELGAKEAEPFFRRYHPPAADVKPASFTVADHQRFGAWGLARLGEDEPLDWIASQIDFARGQLNGVEAMCDVLWWSASTDEEYSTVRARYEAHRRGEKTASVGSKLPRAPTPAAGTIADLDAAISQTPGDATARMRRGNLCFDAGNFQRAMHDYGSAVRALDASNDLAAARLWLTRARFRQREFADAALRGWHRRFGERLDAHRQRIVLHLLGRVSIDELTQGATGADDTAEAWFFAGARALFVGDVEGGQRALERALTVVTKSPTAEALSARSLLESIR